MDLTFDTVATVDWSGGNAKGPTPCADAIWWCIARDRVAEDPRYFRSRQAVEPALLDLIEQELTAGRRMFLGFDFAFGYPSGFVPALTGSQDPLAMWSWFESRIEDTPRANNRFALASDINQALGAPLFWGCPKQHATPYLSMYKRDSAALPFSETRAVEGRATGAFPVWQLFYNGAVGSQVMMGLPVLERLRRAFPGQISVWPFQAPTTPVTLVEIWPSLFAHDVTAQGHLHPIKDAVQVSVMTRKIMSMSADELGAAFDIPETTEGWIFGVQP